MGNTDFYGKGLQVDTSKKFTVVTQFKPGRLTQFFVQDGKKIVAPAPTIEGISDSGDITAEFCTNQFKTFNDRDRFAEVGGFSQLDAALGVPMVLVMSIWDDVRAPPVPLVVSWCVMMLTVSPALLQHALARLHLPPGEGGRARRRPWSLRTGHRRSVRSRTAIRVGQGRVEQHPLWSYRLDRQRLGVLGRLVVVVVGPGAAMHYS